MTKDIVRLQIPKKPEYISVARLSIAGIAYGLGFDVDCIEDLKVALAEACINALKLSQEREIHIEFEVSEDRIFTRVKDVEDITRGDIEDTKELGLGMLIIESLMDEVSFNDFGIEMVKMVGVDKE